jgi:hypothetical protein
MFVLHILAFRSCEGCGKSWKGRVLGLDIYMWPIPTFHDHVFHDYLYPISMHTNIMTRIVI